MAATRGTLPVGAMARDLYEHHCPTCGMTSTRDGRRGWRNLPHACSAACFAQARQSMVSKSNFSRGGGVLRAQRNAAAVTGAS